MLFNKDNQGSVELFNITGTFESNNPYSAIVTEVDAATAELKRLVGSGVVASAEAIYVKPNPTDSEKELLEAVRRPIAFLAVGNHARINILSHGPAGRRMPVGENEKVPFEWMLDRDDREMRERYYRALDALFTHLEESNDSNWETSEIRRKQTACLVSSLSLMEAVYPVDHSYYTYAMLLPLMLECQARMYRRIGEAVRAKLQGNEPDEELLAAARRYVVLKALVTALRRWALSVFPTEVARQFAPSYQGNREKRAATKEEIEWAVNALDTQAAEAMAELLDEAGNNPYDGFPLLPENHPRNKYFTT